LMKMSPHLNHLVLQSQNLISYVYSHGQPHRVPIEMNRKLGSCANPPTQMSDEIVPIA
jgi:hypothetical protein